MDGITQDNIMSYKNLIDDGASFDDVLDKRKLSSKAFARSAAWQERRIVVVGPLLYYFDTAKIDPAELYPKGQYGAV
jgi:hypothetical protein